MTTSIGVVKAVCGGLRTTATKTVGDPGFVISLMMYSIVPG